MLVSIKSKLLCGVAVFVLLTGIQVVLMWTNASDIATNSQKISEELQPIQYKLHMLEVSVIQIQQWLSDISATRGQNGLNDGIDKATENYDSAPEGYN